MQNAIKNIYLRIIIYYVLKTKKSVRRYAGCSVRITTKCVFSQFNYMKYKYIIVGTNIANIIFIGSHYNILIKYIKFFIFYF